LSHKWKRSGQPFISNTEKETSGLFLYSVTPGDLLFLSRSREGTRCDYGERIIYPPPLFHRKSVRASAISIVPHALILSSCDIISKVYIFSSYRSRDFSLFTSARRIGRRSLSIDHLRSDQLAHMRNMLRCTTSNRTIYMYKDLSKVRCNRELMITYYCS